MEQILKGCKKMVRSSAQNSADGGRLRKFMTTSRKKGCGMSHNPDCFSINYKILKY